MHAEYDLTEHRFQTSQSFVVCNQNFYLSITLFRSKQRFKPQSKLDINCHGQSIESNEEVMYLDATIDQICFF